MPNKVVAILCSDLHLCHNPPRARSKEPSWYRAMERYLDALKHNTDHYNVPALIAGDVFDTHNQPVELVNWVYNRLPETCYTIAGQHDLPHHNYENIGKSAYWSLVQAGVIHHVEYGTPRVVDVQGTKLVVHGFSWDAELKNNTVKRKGALHIALVHAYTWTQGYKYPNAPQTGHASVLDKKMSNYDVVVVGDNHKPFIEKGETTVVNCGGFMRRKTNDDFKPSIYKLYADGSVEVVHLDTRRDSLADKEELIDPIHIEGLDEYIGKLQKLQQCQTDYREALLDYAKQQELAQPVFEKLLEAMNDE